MITLNTMGLLKSDLERYCRQLAASSMIYDAIALASELTPGQYRHVKTTLEPIAAYHGLVVYERPTSAGRAICITRPSDLAYCLSL